MTSCVRYQHDLLRLADGCASSIADDLALHLDACHSCRQLFDQGRVDLDPALFEVLPTPARRRILGRLGTARVARSLRLPAAAAAAALLALAASLFLHQAVAPAGGERIAVALVEDHIRYLGHPDRLAGGDRASLEDLIGSYVDFPVRFPVPADSRLTGARRCFVLGRRVALAFYDTPAGPVSYFILPADDLRPPRGSCGAGFSCAASRGYDLVCWRRTGLIHALVGRSDAGLLKLASALAR